MQRPYRAIPLDQPIETGEFVYGWYIEDALGECFIINTADTSPPVSARKVNSLTGSHDIVILGAVTVHPSTVGQAAGLQDKAGTESCAGDICSDGSKKYEVRWNSSAARFYLIGGVICKDIRTIVKMIIIGTIHHPALLEGGKK